jgi:hypothetical protein
MIGSLRGPGSVRKRLAARRLAAVLAAALTLASAAPAQTPGEYAVKGAFLLNFARYTEWPPAAFSGSTTPLVLCVVGDDPFGSALDSVEGKLVRGRPIRIDRNIDAAGLPSCHIAFISDSERSRVDSLLKITDTASVLTVSDIDRFARRGGVIGLFLEGERVRFEVNLRTAERAQLRLSSNLLRLATLVRQ